MSRRLASTGPMIVKSWRDLGKLGYGSGGAADGPFVRNGIFIQGNGGLKDAVNTGGPGLPLSRRRRVENPGMKKRHRFRAVGTFLCLRCNMVREGHDRLMEKLG